MTIYPGVEEANLTLFHPGATPSFIYCRCTGTSNSVFPFFRDFYSYGGGVIFIFVKQTPPPICLEPRKNGKTESLIVNFFRYAMLWHGKV